VLAHFGDREGVTAGVAINVSGGKIALWSPNIEHPLSEEPASSLLAQSTPSEVESLEVGRRQLLKASSDYRSLKEKGNIASWTGRRGRVCFFADPGRDPRQDPINPVSIHDHSTVIHQLMLHQKLKVHLKHDRETFSPKNCTFSLGDLHSLFPPNFRALRFVAVE